MFATATRNFVEEVDPDGGLVPVSSLKDSISVLSVVVKRKRFWLWQKPKYIPTDFQLNDLLTGDEPLTPGITATEFIKYNGTYGGNIEGNLNANFGKSKVNTDVTVTGKDSSKLQSALGSLRKEELDVQKLLRDCKDRTLDMTHALVKQTKERQRQSFGIVKERITNTQPCSVIEDKQQSGQCGGGLSLCGPQNQKFSLKETGSLGKDSNVTMEIPVGTTLAYVLIELEIKHDGHFELMVMSGSSGGFEVDGPRRVEPLAVCGAPPGTSENKHLSLELEPINKHFQLLAALPATSRSALLQHITKVMEDQGAVASLESVLEQMCQNRKPSLAEAATTDAQRENIQAIVGLLEESSQAEEATSALKALHLLAGAMDEMTDDCLASLRSCCSPAVLPSLELLVQCVSGEGQVPLSSVDLPGDVYERTERLFASSNVSLKRDGETLRTDIKQQAGNLPLVLCIAVRGLASLAHTE